MPESYYDTHAKAYFELTVNVNMATVYPKFLQHIKPAGQILDAGCGSGRDSHAFSRLGFQVDAIDASAEMAKFASDFTGLPVKHLAFEYLDEHERYDGIWACASLLHTPFTTLPALFTRFERALKPGGTWYLSFKHGKGERELNGRHFTYLDLPALKQLLTHTRELSLVEHWLTGDNIPGRTERWFNALITKQHKA